MIGLPKKVLIKTRRELVELHKKCITTFLTQRSVKHRIQVKFFKLYDMYVGINNIYDYFHKPIKVFVNALITNRLDQIQDHMTPSKSSKKRKNEQKRYK